MEQDNQMSVPVAQDVVDELQQMMAFGQPAVVQLATSCDRCQSRLGAMAEWDHGHIENQVRYRYFRVTVVCLSRCGFAQVTGQQFAIRG